MNITEFVLAQPPDKTIHLRGDELADFLASIDPDLRTPWGESLREYLMAQKPTLIRGVPDPPPYLDEMDRQGFGNVYGRDWDFER